jgi:hypothetical protein
MGVGVLVCIASLGFGWPGRTAWVCRPHGVASFSREVPRAATSREPPYVCAEACGGVALWALNPCHTLSVSHTVPPPPALHARHSWAASAALWPFPGAHASPSSPSTAPQVPSEKLCPSSLSSGSSGGLLGGLDLGQLAGSSALALARAVTIVPVLIVKANTVGKYITVPAQVRMIPRIVVGCVGAFAYCLDV